jgi:hypothetical protein
MTTTQNPTISTANPNPAQGFPFGIWNDNMGHYVARFETLEAAMTKVLTMVAGPFHGYRVIEISQDGGTTQHYRSW